MCWFDKICVFVGFELIGVKKYIKYDTTRVESYETKSGLYKPI